MISGSLITTPTNFYSNRKDREYMEIAEELDAANTEDDLVNSIASMLQTVPPLPKESSIFRIPYMIHRVNEESYTPMILSVGPFHHGKEQLQEMEVHKQRYLVDFLKRRPDLNLKDYVRTLRESEERARNCYAETVNYTSDAFIRMMLLDGCFIVELSLKYLHLEGNQDDPIFKSTVVRQEIRRDMILLENQLPFFVLEQLFKLNVQGELHQGCTFRVITLNFMKTFIGLPKELRTFDDSNHEAKHIVNLYLQCYAPTGARLSPKALRGFISIPNATRLHEASIKFRQSTSPIANFLDIKFANGILEIPTLVFGDDTETFLRNLIAFEQCDNGNTRYISDFIFLMVCLIDSPSDVGLLRRGGIIDNLLGDDEELAKVFNKLRSGVCNSSQYYFCQLSEAIDDYCNSRSNVWRAKLKRDYFNTPWAIISVIAAVILLILAFIQSVCSFIPSYHR